MDLSKFSDAELRELDAQITVAIKGGREQNLAIAMEQIRAVASSVGLSLEEILKDKGSTPAKERAKTQGYRDPVNPKNTWGGAGPRPAWLKSALAAGVPLEQLRA